VDIALYIHHDDACHPIETAALRPPFCIKMAAFLIFAVPEPQ